MDGWLITAILLFIWSDLLLMTALVALIRRGWRARRTTAAGAIGAEVVLVRPLAGEEPGLLRRLLSVREARFDARPRVRFTVAEPTDPAFATAARAAELLRSEGWDAKAVAAAMAGPNRKAAQLAALLGSVDAEIVISADSDVDLADTDLGALTRALEHDPRLGAVYAPPAEHAPAETIGDRASGAFLNGSLHAFPLISALDPRGFVGKLFALRTGAARRIDMAELVDYLGEDMELARRLRQAGFKTMAVSQVARSRARGRRLRDVIARFGRWLAVIRAQRGWLLASYPLLFGATTPLLALAGTVGFASDGMAGQIAWAAAGVALAGRWLVALGARRFSGLSVTVGALSTDVVLADLVVWGAFVRAVALTRVMWRGRILRITPTGRLVAADGS